MKTRDVFVFDFDGVICDSADETGWSGWLAARRLWPDAFATATPPDSYLEDFRRIRIYLETGFEAVLIARGWRDGVRTDEFCQNYSQTLACLQERYKVDRPSLIEVFAATRREWIASEREKWLATHRFYSPVVKALRSFSGEWYILSTKQKEFLVELCRDGGLGLAEDRIWGLERGPKESVLAELLDSGCDALYFIEDRLATLQRIVDTISDDRIHLFLACWGYLSRKDREIAASSAKIRIIEQEKMALFLQNPAHFS